jgi:hypothetical protein
MHNLPKSLIESAHKLICESRMTTTIVNASVPFTPLHGMNRTDVFHPMLLQLCEGTNDLLIDGTHNNFNDWARHTEHNNNIHYNVVDYTNHNQIPQAVNRNSKMTDYHPNLVDYYLNDMKQHEKTAIRHFTSAGLNSNYPSGSYHINTHLLTSHLNNVPNDKILIHPSGEVFNFDHMDSALSSTLPQDITTYSGVKFDPEHVHNHNIIVLPFYSSSSLRRLSGAKYALHADKSDPTYHILQVEHKAGDTGLYIGNSSDVTKFKDDEFIMPRNSPLKLHGFHDYHIVHDNINHTFRVWKASRLR